MKSEILCADFPKSRKKLCEKFTDLSIKIALNSSKR